jgi:HD-GYP domain-containing protein (c-di-GMP phosphodiesterase class II)
MLKRENQLNALAHALIVVLLLAVVTLVIGIATGLRLPDLWVLSNGYAGILVVGLLLVFILYLVDQHRKLRRELLKTHERLELANTEALAAYDRLSFAQHTASIMASLDEADVLQQVLVDCARHFGADAAAVVGEDVTLIANEGVSADEAEAAVLQVALNVVRAGSATATAEDTSGGEALAVPLRMRDELRSVVCLWRRGEPFSSDQLEGLVLTARIIELSLENRMLLTEARDQLNGTLQVLTALIDQRIPDYQERSGRIADRAVAIGRILGFKRRDLTDIRIAALLADTGMLNLPEQLSQLESSGSLADVDVLKKHPVLGAELARRANFSPQVQETIHDHHERLDGSGYPRSRRGEAIPLAARILAVCDVYDSLTSPRPGRPSMSSQQAMAHIARGAGTLYDVQVVRALLQMAGHDVTSIADRQEPDDRPARATTRPAGHRSTAGIS